MIDGVSYDFGIMMSVLNTVMLDTLLPTKLLFKREFSDFGGARKKERYVIHKPLATFFGLRQNVHVEKKKVVEKLL